MVSDHAIFYTWLYPYDLRLICQVEVKTSQERVVGWAPDNVRMILFAPFGSTKNKGCRCVWHAEPRLLYNILNKDIM